MKSNRTPSSACLDRALLAALGLVVVSAIGCGNGLSTVTGQVTYNGAALAGGEDVRGTVYLFPEGGTGVPAVGLLDEEGRYEASTGSQAGVAPGAYLVTISATQLIPSKIDGEAPGGRPITPRRYADPSTSGLRVEVGPGTNEFDFELQGDAPKQRRSRRR